MSEGSGNQSGSGQSVMTEQVSKQAQQAKQQTQQAAQQAVSGAESALDSQKDKGAQTLTQTADALRKTSQDLQQNNIPVAGQAIDMAAGKLEDAAGYLRTHNVSQLIDDAERFARNNGTIVMGGAFVLGLIAARFLKSSPPDQQSGPGGYQSRPYQGYNTAAYRAPAGAYGAGYQPYAYGETYGGYATDSFQPGFEATDYELESDTPDGEGMV